LAVYAAHLAQTKKWTTIIRCVSDITKLHELKGLDSPTQDKQFKVVLEGIKRAKGICQKQALAFSPG
jgi:hypothetical protein